MLSHRIATGQKVVGKKVGATSAAVQTLLKVSQPDFGLLLSDMIYNDGETIPMSRLIAAQGGRRNRLHSEARSARSGRDARRCPGGDGMRHAPSRSSTAGSTTGKSGIVDTVADNASCGVFALGGAARDPKKIDLDLCGMVLEKNGEVVATGAGAAALGHPASAVAWLANTLGRLGIPLAGGRDRSVRLSGDAHSGQGGRQLASFHRGRWANARSVSVRFSSWRSTKRPSPIWRKFSKTRNWRRARSRRFRSRHPEIDRRGRLRHPARNPPPQTGARNEIRRDQGGADFAR